MKKRTKIGICILVFLLLAGAGTGIYLGDYYRTGPDVEAQTAGSSAFLDPDGNWVLTPVDGQGGNTGFLFYPGAKVEESAYLPLMSRIAQAGYYCVIVKMPFHLAVLDRDAGSRIKEEHPEISEWFIGGHSLGGAMAQAEAAADPDGYAGLVLLAAYGTKDMSAAPLPALGIYGSRDGVMNREKLAEGRALMPLGYEEIVLEGGNHAGFGWYGPQKGDKTAEISQKEQWEQTAAAVLQFFDRNGTAGTK